MHTSPRKIPKQMLTILDLNFFFFLLIKSNLFFVDFLQDVPKRHYSRHDTEDEDSGKIF